MQPVLLPDGSRNPVIVRAHEEWSDYYYKHVRDNLPKVFVEEYEHRDGFHDYCIEGISIDKSDKETVKLRIDMDDSGKKCSIIYSGVSEFSLICSKVYTEQNGDFLGIWNIDEFEKIDSCEFSHDILLAFGETVRIVFSSIQIHST